MQKGREFLGLPVFSWQQDCLVGRVADLQLSAEIDRLEALILQKKSVARTHPTVARAELLKVYPDGVIVKSAASLKNRRDPAVRYSRFLAEAAFELREGCVIADLFFDERFAVAGFEVSRGFWRDLSAGRDFIGRVDGEKLWKMQESGR